MEEGDEQGGCVEQRVLSSLMPFSDTIAYTAPYHGPLSTEHCTRTQPRKE